MTSRLLPLSAAFVVSVHLATTAFMTGLIWYAQIVHYPLMAGWPHDRFAELAQNHVGTMSRLTIPGMLLEALFAILLVVRPPRGLPAWLPAAGAAALCGIWASTFLIQVPCSHLLALGWDETVHSRLVNTNWIRTLLWSARLMLATAAVQMLLPDLDGPDPSAVK